MTNITELYDNMCRVLTDYEEFVGGKGDDSDIYEHAANMYEMLVTVQNNWEMLKEDD